MEGNAQAIRALRPMDSRSRIGVRDGLCGNDGANRCRTDLPWRNAHKRLAPFAHVRHNEPFYFARERLHVV
jgi:hypothetical protein